jgi:hypothetical protein
MREIKVDNFSGMNNIVVKAKRTMAEPSIILNAIVEPDGSLIKRPGFEKIIDLPDAHSLWTNDKGIVLCAAKGKVYRVIDGTTIVELKDTAKADTPMSYLEVSGKIYLSNKGWTGMYDPELNTIGDWGVSIPVTPVLIQAEGGLPAGVYGVCLTALSTYGRPSGNSGISEISLAAPGGITISNLSENASVWMTDPNGSQLFYVGAGPIITELPEHPEPIPTMWGTPPNPMSQLCWAFGRAWGAIKKRVYYSEPYQPELFRLSTGFFDFDETVLMIAKTDQGLFVGCERNTYYLSQTNPADMVQSTVGVGVVPGTLCYASDLGELGKNVPVWVGKDGVYAGLADGHVLNVAKDKLRIDPQQVQGASFYRVQDGRKQMLFSMKHNQPKGQVVGFGDLAACDVVRNGVVI